MDKLNPSSIFDKLNDKFNDKLDYVDNSNVYDGSKVYNLEVNTNSSSNGILAKTTVEKDGKFYLVKTGEFRRPRFSKLEPVTEVICSEIIKLLGVNCANYILKELSLVGNEYWKEQNVLCCLSEIFITDNEKSISASKLLGIKNKRASYDDLIKVFNVEDINNMLVVDYLINNTDRHLRNFSLVINNNDGSVRFAPLYDHGFSLGQDLDDDYLEEESGDFCYVYDDCDYSKCCGVTNHQQLNNVEFTSVNLDVGVNSLLNIIDKYSDYLPSYRVEFMKYLLERRLNYARKIFSKREGIYFRRDN